MHVRGGVVCVSKTNSPPLFLLLLFFTTTSRIQVRDWRQHAQGNEIISLPTRCIASHAPREYLVPHTGLLTRIARSPSQVGYNTSMDRFFLFNMTTLFLLVVVSTIWSVFNGSVDPRLAEANCTLAGLMTCTLNNIMCVGSLFAFFALNIAW
jgi:hypothetical protein